jgi:hypothetical protein
MKVLIGRDERPTKKVTLRWLWEPRDIWVGVFWNRAEGFLLIYVGLLPCLPLCLAIREDS